MTEIARKLLISSRSGKVRECEELVRQHPDIDFSDPPLCRSALWHAAWRGHEPVCKLLLEKGASPSIYDRDGRTPLHEAAAAGHIGVLAVLLTKGAEINAIDKDGYTPLMLATMRNKHEAAEFLVFKGADPSIVSFKSNIGCYHLAMFNGQIDFAQKLEQKGAWTNALRLNEKNAMEKALKLVLLE